MQNNGARLSIDWWHTTVCAALRTRAGDQVPVVVDGSVVSPVGVAVSDDGGVHPGRGGELIGAEHPQWYVPMPGQRLSDERVTVGAVVVEPVDLVAATLRRVAAAASAGAGGVAPGEVVVCVPAGWVGHQRQRLREAAGRAGLAPPWLLDGADAIVRHQLAAGLVLPVGAVVAVCRIDATVGEVVILRWGGDGLERLATHDLGAVGETVGATLVEQAAAALAAALDAVQVPGPSVAAVFCHAPDAVMADLRTALVSAAGLAVTPVRVGDLAAALGGLTATATVSAGPARRSGRSTRLVQSLGGVVVGAAGAAMLVYQLFNSGQAYPATSVTAATLVTQWCAWGLAPLFALLGMVSAALATSDIQTIGASARNSTDGPDPGLGSALMSAAATGVAAAVLLALAGGAHFQVAPTPMLGWALGSTVLVAGVVAVLGLMVTRLPMPGGWPDRLRFPAAASGLAAVSTVVVAGAYVAIPIPDERAWWVMEHAGAVGIGFAVAWLAVRRWNRLLVAGSVLGGSATYAVSLDTFDTIGAVLIGAITMWWLVRLLQILVPLLSRPAGPDPGQAATVWAQPTGRD